MIKEITAELFRIIYNLKDFGMMYEEFRIISEHALPILLNRNVLFGIIWDNILQKMMLMNLKMIIIVSENIT